MLELGCGWGLVGMACAKTFQAQVTGLDADAAVFPYLQLHAQRNEVHMATRQGTFAGSVANFAQEVMKGQLPLSVGGITRPGRRIVRLQCDPRLRSQPASVSS